MITATDSSSTFELAQYAESQLRPLVDQLQGGSLQIDLHLGSPFFAKNGKDWSISVVANEFAAVGEQGDYVSYSVLIDTSEAVDRAVMDVRRHLSKATA